MSDDLAKAKAARALAEAQLASALSMVGQLTVERNDAVEALTACFTQSCGDYDRTTGEHSYDHMCLSSYEHAQDFLIQVGAIKKEKCRRP